MALNSMNKRGWTYTDDLGTHWGITAVKAITDQVNGALAPKVGGEAITTTDNPWPASWRPRTVRMTHGAYVKWQIAYDTTCDLWTDGATTLQLNEGADVAQYTGSTIHRGERKRAATAQTA